MAAPEITSGVSTTQVQEQHRPSWSLLLWFGILVVVCYAPVLRLLILQWEHDPDVGHGFFVPLVTILIIWLKRERLAELPVVPNPWGLALVVYAALQLLAASLGAELFLARTAFVLSLIGIVLTLFGTRYAREIAFPLGLLFFMVPIPAILFNQITFPLQLLASSGAEQALGLMHIPVARAGNILEVSGHPLLVTEACSGIRSLLTLSFAMLVYGYFCERRLWLRAVLFAAAIPGALGANGARVALTGLLTYKDPKLAEGIIHSTSGAVIFLVSVLLVVGFHGLVCGMLNRLKRSN